MGTTHFSSLQVGGVPTMGTGGLLPYTGNWWFVDSLNGSDGNQGSAQFPFSTLAQAQLAAAANNNDVICFNSNGILRLASTLNWNKDKVHLIGIGAATEIASRCRIAPVATAAAFTPLVNVTAQGCTFMNFQAYSGFSTGMAAQICWAEAGQRNSYSNVQFSGMNDAASANSTTSRAITIGGAGQGENTFRNCTFGDDTIARTAANSTLQFLGNSPRNVFRDCRFIAYLTGSGSGAFHILAANAGLDRWAEFDNCTFMSSVQSGGSSAMANCCSMTTPGGLVLLNSPAGAGITAWDSGSGFVYVTGSAPVFATAGIGVT